MVNSDTFRYKNKITGNTYNVAAGAAGYIANKNGAQNIELAIPLKYLGNFWRALNMPLISCEFFNQFFRTYKRRRKINGRAEFFRTYDIIKRI